MASPTNGNAAKKYYGQNLCDETSFYILNASREELLELLNCLIDEALDKSSGTGNPIRVAKCARYIQEIANPKSESEREKAEQECRRWLCEIWVEDQPKPASAFKKVRKLVGVVVGTAILLALLVATFLFNTTAGKGQPMTERYQFYAQHAEELRAQGMDEVLEIEDHTFYRVETVAIYYNPQAVAMSCGEHILYPTVTADGTRFAYIKEESVPYSTYKKQWEFISTEGKCYFSIQKGDDWKVCDYPHFISVESNIEGLTFYVAECCGAYTGDGNYNGYQYHVQGNTVEDVIRIIQSLEIYQGELLP